jgi:hypothetical protein
LLKDHSEAKHYCPNNQVAVPADRVLYTFPLTGNITQGTGVNNRDGDAISIEAIKVQFTFSSGAWVNNGAHMTSFRVLLIEHQKQIGLGSSAQWYPSTGGGGGLQQSDLYQQNFSYKTIDGIIDAKLATVHYDSIVSLEPKSYWTNAIDGTTTSTDLARVFKVHKFQCKVGKRLQFERGTSVAVGKHNYYLVVIPYNGNGSSDVGDFTVVTDVIFKETL